jgi:hypothetical protein
MGKGKRLEIVILFYSRNAVGSPNLCQNPVHNRKGQSSVFRVLPILLITCRSTFEHIFR